MSDTKPIAPRRRSASAESALRAELARIEAMTIKERVKSALSLPERFAWPAPALPCQAPSPDATQAPSRSGKQPSGR